MARLLVSALFCIVLPILGSAQDVPSSLNVIEGFVRNIADSLQVIAGPSPDTLRVHVYEHPDAPWFESIIAQRSQELGIPFRAVRGNESAVGLVIANAATTLETSNHADSLVRSVALVASVRHNGVVRQLPAQKRQDVIPYEQGLRAQSDQHASTKAELPARQPSLWDDVLQPIVFIGAAVVIIVLLFTVRSQ